MGYRRYGSANKRLLVAESTGELNWQLGQFESPVSYHVKQYLVSYYFGLLVRSLFRCYEHRLAPSELVMI